MYILDINKLEEGDILLTAQKGVVSKAIRKSTGSDFSHAILYVGQGSYIHSDGDGVHSGNIQRLLFKKDKYVKVLRPKNNKAAGIASLFARSQIGKQYSVKDAISTKTKGVKTAPSNRQFCSRLVAQSFEYAGLKLVNDVDYCTPEEINKSSYLDEIVGVVRAATEGEINFANSDSSIQRQAKITNHILSETRKITGHDLQTMEELSYFVIENSQYDMQIVNIFKESGYLSMWKHEIEHNPWRYDGEMFLSLPVSNEEKRKMAAFELDSAEEQLKLYSRNYLAYQQLSMNGKLSCIDMNMQLYKNLIDQMNKRKSTAEYVLNNT